MQTTKSKRIVTIESWFDIKERHEVWEEGELPAVGEGQLVLITGASGSGKSRLLRRYLRHFRLRDPESWIDVDRMTLRDCAVVDCLSRSSFDAAVEMLGRVGLGEAFLYLRNAWELSDGQRWRLKLAKALLRAKSLKGRAPARPHPSPRIIAADEFCALLDRVSACVIARMLRKTIDRLPGVSAIVATSHDDLARALDPDIRIHCDFQGKSSITSRQGLESDANHSSMNSPTNYSEMTSGSRGER